jgi:hypothetical protein
MIELAPLELDQFGCLPGEREQAERDFEMERLEREREMSRWWASRGLDRA